MPRDHMQVLGSNLGGFLTIEDAAKLSQPKADAGDVIVLAPDTGLTDIPVQVPGGVQAICLLNPRLKPGVLVSIDMSLILQSVVDEGFTSTRGGNITVSQSNGLTRKSESSLSKTG